MSIASRATGRVYRRAIRPVFGFQPEQLAAWTLPVAAARLIENVPGERSHLLALIDRLLQS